MNERSVRFTPVVVAAMAAFIIGVGVTGCTFADAPAKTGVDAAASHGIDPPQQDPLWAYSESSEVSKALIRASDLLTVKCMAKFGFTYHPIVFSKDVGAGDRVDADRLYGITDAKVAAVYGYLPAPVPQAVDANAASENAAYLLVLLGVKANQAPAMTAAQAKSPGQVGGVTIPAGGCLGAARIQISGSLNGEPDQGSLGDDLRGKAYDDAWNDPRSQAAMTEWAACMAKSGYKRKDPVNDDVKPSNEKDGKITPAPQSEVQEALADIACKKKTDFVAKVNAVNVEYSKKAIEDNQVALQAYKDFYDNLLRKADAVISSDG